MPVPPPHPLNISTKLPLDVLERICSAALIDHSTSASSGASGDGGSIPLLVLDSQWHKACSRVLYREITLDGDDELLLLAAELDTDVDAGSLPDPSRKSRSSRVVAQLRAITTNEVYASSVQVLRLVPGQEAWRYLPEPSPEVSTDTLPEALAEPSLGSPGVGFVKPDPLDDVALYGLITQLSCLEELHWTTPRPMPCIVAEALAKSKQIRSISIGACQTGMATEAAASDISLQRWNAAVFPILPLARLTSVTLRALSQEGVRLLQGALPGLVACEKLCLEDTPFLDDALLIALTQGAGHLRVLAIRRMSGTQITNKGLAYLLENSSSLEELELTELEGRLTKKCWTEVKSYPSSFKSMRIAFNEASTTLHTWAMDHLESISAFLANAPPLQEFSIRRMVPQEAQLPMMHDAIALSPLLTPKTIPMGLTGQVLQHSRTLQRLDLTYWEIPFEASKAVLDSCPLVSELSIMLDTPFSKLLTMNTAFLVAQKLQVLQVSVPPRHTPALSQDSVTAITPIKGGGNSRSAAGFIVRRASNAGIAQPDDSGIVMSPARGRQGSVSATVVPKEAVPPLRDVKKFVKRATCLHSVEWIGRGGIGVWTIPKNDGGKEAKITFMPIDEAIAEEAAARQSNILPGLQEPEAGPPGAPLRRRVRGTTASSYTSMSSLTSSGDTSSSNTTAGASMFRDGYSGLSDSPTSSKAHFEIPEMPVTPVARNFAFGNNRKSRSKSMSHDVNVEQTPTKGRTSKSNSISTPSSTKQDERNVIRVIHGGGWVSRKTFRGTGNVSKSASTPTPATKDEGAEQTSKRSGRGGRRERKSKAEAQLQIEVPQPLTEQNLRSVPVTSSMVEFPDLASPVGGKAKAEKVESKVKGRNGKK